jgi:hypothetical protein
MVLYKIIKCRECSKVQITTAKEKLRCIRCNKVRLILNQKPLYETEFSAVARQFLIQYNRELRNRELNKNEIHR